MNVFKLIFIVLLIACSNSKNATKQLTNNKVDERIVLPLDDSGKSKIAFLTFTAERTDSINDVYKVKLFDKKIVEGVLKEPAFAEEPTIEPYHFYCELLNENKQRLKLLKVGDPLSTSYEYLEEDKSFNKKVITKTKGEFTVRFMLDKKIKFLYIYRHSISLNQLKPIYYAVL